MRRQLIGRNVTGVRGDAASRRPRPSVRYVKREKGKIDVLFGERWQGRGRTTGRDYRAALDAAFGLNARRNAVYGQKALPLFNDGGIDHHDRISCFGEGFSWFRRVCGEQGSIALLRTHVAKRTEGPEDPRERAGPGPIATPMQEEFSPRRRRRDVRVPNPRGKMGQPEESRRSRCFLASDDSSFVNGVELAVDGLSPSEIADLGECMIAKHSPNPIGNQKSLVGSDRDCSRLTA